MSVAFAPGLRRARVDIERDHRLDLGGPVDLGNGLAFVVQIDEGSQGRIGNLALAATRAQMTAAPFSTPFRDRDNENHTLSAAQVIDLAEQALAKVTAIREASWALKDMDPIPADFADDKYWPA